MKTKSKALLSAVVAAGGLAVPMSHPATANTAPSGSYGFRYMNGSSGDGMYNWDYLSQSVSSGNVSMPVNLIWMNNADTDKIDATMYYVGYTGGGSTKWGRGIDNSYSSYPQWDYNGGRKNCGSSSCSQNSHYRPYAVPASDNRMGYTTTYGYWIWAASHEDIWENTPSQQFGYSETSEASVAQWFSNVGANSEWMGNTAGEWQGTTYLDSNGYATKINVT